MVLGEAGVWWEVGRLRSTAPPAGLEPARLAPEARALSAELQGQGGLNIACAFPANKVARRRSECLCVRTSAGGRTLHCSW